MGKDGEVNIYALPLEVETLRLIKQYMSYTGLLYPYLSEETILETYDQMKRDKFTKVRRTWLGLLNMVLALSTSTSVNREITSKQRTKESDVYYQRALGLCNNQILRGTSLEIGKHILGWSLCPFETR